MTLCPLYYSAAEDFALSICWYGSRSTLSGSSALVLIESWDCESGWVERFIAFSVFVLVIGYYDELRGSSFCVRYIPLVLICLGCFRVLSASVKSTVCTGLCSCRDISAVFWRSAYRVVSGCRQMFDTFQQFKQILFVGLGYKLCWFIRIFWTLRNTLILAEV